MGYMMFTLWWTNKKLLKMAIEIVDFPINSMVIFHCYLYVHQRVYGLRNSTMAHGNMNSSWLYHGKYPDCAWLSQMGKTVKGKYGPLSWE